jgi:hypothetical protein
VNRIWVSRWVGWVVLLALSLAALAGSVRAASVEPIVVEGNPTCQDLGYDLGFKVDPPVVGTQTYLIDGHYTLTTTIDSALEYLDWASELGVDAVIVKGGPNAILWAYEPPAESFGDVTLHAPNNPNNNRPYAMSHAEFCYDYALNLSKTVQTVRNLQYLWDIDKVVEPDQIQMPVGATEVVDYAVTLTGAVEEAYAVYGTISISSPYTVTIVGVSDVVAPDIEASVECEADLPYELPAWHTLQCAYQASVPSDAPGSNTATVTTEGIVEGSQVTATFSFNGEIVEVDRCVVVSDSSPEGPQEVEVCAEALPWADSYSQQIGPYPCGTHAAENTVSYEAVDTGTTGEDTAVIQVFVPCELTRPRTPAYWKTHGDPEDPKKYDERWEAVGGPEAPFFGSGQTYIEVLWTSPSGGNVYYVLAHQFIAARIHMLNGLPMPDETLKAFEEAEALFEQHLPDDDGLRRKSKADLQDQFVALAQVLKAYNH